MKNATFKQLLIISVVILTSLLTITLAQELDSNKYTIKDSTIDSGGGNTQSSNYGILVTVADPAAFAKLESTSYRVNSGYISTFQANVPKIKCFETNTTSGTTSCTYVGANGMQGVCGLPGCYDRAKVEIDTQNNPYDTLYLVKIVNLTKSVTYYLQSDHTIATTYDINDFLDQCAIEGIDPEEPSCDNGEARENDALQQTNIYGLTPGDEYSIQAQALQGDYTGTAFSPIATTTTENIQITLDIDTAETDTESTAPYTIDMGVLNTVDTTTSLKSIWTDISTNFQTGVNLYVQDEYSGLYESSTASTLNSETEDIDSIGNTNGGYGLKTISITQQSLGPLKSTSTIYQTNETNEVGRLQNNTMNLLFYTNTLEGTKGQITEGRGQVKIKAKAAGTLPSGQYNDIINFYCTTNI